MRFRRHTDFTPWKKVLRWAMTLGVGSLFVFRVAHAQNPAAEVPQKNLITSIGNFWNLTEQERATSHPFRFECDITFYDPLWNNLWVQTANEASYVSVGKRKLPFKSGQHVVVSGTFEPPNREFSFEHATVVSTSPANIDAPSIAGQLRRGDLYSGRLVTIEAFVVQEDRIDPQHLHLQLSVEGETVFAIVMLDPAKPVPGFIDSTVRIRGVYMYDQAALPNGQKVSLELRIPGIEDIANVSWLGSDPRFKLPLSSIESLTQFSRRTLVRVAGKVKAQEVGRYLRIRDETGQIDLITGQTRTCAINEQVEAIGYPAIEGTDWKLAEALFRSVTTPLPVVHGAPNEVLRVAQQVLELSREEAAAGRSVLLSGVVTWSHPDTPFIYVQDASGGVCVSGDKDILTELIKVPGRNIEIKGRTAMGAFAPMVIASETAQLGNLVMPEANQVSLELALTGVNEAQWVEMRGYLRKVENDGAWTHLEVATSAGNFRAELPPAGNLSALEGSVIRLHGVCVAEANDHRKLTGIKLLVPAASFVQVEEAAPKDLFDQPSRLLANLGQYGTLQSFNRRVRVSGTVVHHSPGHFINIIEGDETLMVMSRQTTPLVPGDRVDAVGFLGRQGGRSVLREAVYRQTGKGEAPEPRMLIDPATIRSELDGNLVRIEATLIDNSSVSDHVRLTLQSDNAIFEAYLERASSEERRASPFLVGSILRLTGVYETKYAEDGQGGAFLIRLRSPQDVELVARPSALTRGRILTFSATLAVGILLFIGWVVALRRRVQQQTAQIRNQLQRESRLESELQRATKLESLGILAGGIAHDFNNLLTVVMGNISLAILDLKHETESTSWLREAERAVARARDLTQQLLTFSKGGAPLRSAVVLADVVKEVAQFALRGSNVRCAFDIAPDLWAADVDKGQIGQVVQNVVINAMQVMPDGGQIDITLRNETSDPGFGKILEPGKYLKLTIADRGVGIAPENLGRIFEPYFTTKKTGHGLGLATVYSIVKKHHGHITVESIVGQGTSFHIWLPAASAGLVSTPDKRQEPIEIELGKGRVLFMDDDLEIRRLGLAMLQRLGYETVAVCDGSEAVAEYRKYLGSAEPYDFVILDLTVAGGVGGCEAMKQLLKLDPEVKAIVSSGYSNDEVLANYRNYGFSGIVSKPYETAALAQVLNQLFQRSAA